jgi:hypothetical protein
MIQSTKLLKGIIYSLSEIAGTQIFTGQQLFQVKEDQSFLNQFMNSSQ